MSKELQETNLGTVQRAKGMSRVRGGQRLIMRSLLGHI